MSPQDRQSGFEPQLVEKRETTLADSLQEKIIGLYGLGMSLWDICSHIPTIRKLPYTTNTVEGLLRQVRKVTKTKGAFTRDMTLLKLVYPATKNIEKKRTSPLYNRGLVIQQLYSKFGQRIPLSLTTHSSGAGPKGMKKPDSV